MTCNKVGCFFTFLLNVMTWINLNKVVCRINLNKIAYGINSNKVAQVHKIN
jgi:hypothetical protein